MIIIWTLEHRSSSKFQGKSLMDSVNIGVFSSKEKAIEFALNNMDYIDEDTNAWFYLGNDKLDPETYVDMPEHQMVCIDREKNISFGYQPVELPCIIPEEFRNK